MPYESCVPVKNYTLCQSMQPNNLIKKQISHMGRITSFETWNEMIHLCTSIHYYNLQGLNHYLVEFSVNPKQNSYLLNLKVCWEQVKACTIQHSDSFLSHVDISYTYSHTFVHLPSSQAKNKIKSLSQVFYQHQSVQPTRDYVFLEPRFPSLSNWEYITNCS